MNLQLILDRTRSVLRRKHLAYATEAAYCNWIRRYASFVLALKRPGLTSEEKFERFLTQIGKRGGSASTQNQAFNAINFLYGDVLQKPLGSVQALPVRTRARVRIARDRSEVAQLLEALEDLHGYPIRHSCSSFTAEAGKALTLGQGHTSIFHLWKNSSSVAALFCNCLGEAPSLQ